MLSNKEFDPSRLMVFDKNADGGEGNGGSEQGSSADTPQRKYQGCMAAEMEAEALQDLSIVDRIDWIVENNKARETVV